MSTAKRQNIALKIFLSSGGSGSGSGSGGSGNPKQHRFLVVDVYQIVLVQPDATRLGWGVATFVGFLQVLLIFLDNLNLWCSSHVFTKNYFLTNCRVFSTNSSHLEMNSSELTRVAIG